MELVEAVLTPRVGGWDFRNPHFQLLQWSVRDCGSGGNMTCAAVFWIAAQIIEQRRSGLQFLPSRNRLAPLRYNPAISCVLKRTSIRGTNFIACWACTEMFKSLISRPNRIRFSKISCYRPLGPYDFDFCNKSKKKISCLCTSNKIYFSDRLTIDKFKILRLIFSAILVGTCVLKVFLFSSNQKNSILI